MMKKSAVITASLLILRILLSPSAGGYALDYTIPATGGCPLPNHLLFGNGIAISRQWSTSLPLFPTILTVAPNGSSAQLDEIEQTILQSFTIWTGVTGSTLNAITNPSAFAPIVRVSQADACSNDGTNNVDGLNTICFNQSSDAFTTGVLSFTRVITAGAVGQSVGVSGPAAFVGQILDADILFNPAVQASFATPGALSTPQGQGAYDLETLITHELGHELGLDHSAIWRAMMFPFAPPPGTFLGDRPTSFSLDAPLADDDRAGARELYFDPSDTVDVGSISGHVLPANPFALATIPQPSPTTSVTGIFATQVVAVDADTGAVIAATLGGWSCNGAAPPTAFDGSFTIDHLPVGHNYAIYAEPYDGPALPADFTAATASLCGPAAPSCATPAVNTNFATRFRPPQ